MGSSSLSEGCIGTIIIRHHRTTARNSYRNLSQTIQWLQLVHRRGNSVWGWKTSEQHWNDDATWVDNDSRPNWKELRDPLNPSQSLDMAFVLTVAVPEPRAWGMLAGLVWQASPCAAVSAADAVANT